MVEWDKNLGLISRWVNGRDRKEIAVLCGHCHMPINPGDETVTHRVSRIGLLIFHLRCVPKQK